MSSCNDEVPTDVRNVSEELKMWITDYPVHNEFEQHPAWAKNVVVESKDDGQYKKNSLLFKWPKISRECWIKSDKHYELTSMI